MHLLHHFMICDHVRNVGKNLDKCGGYRQLRLIKIAVGQIITTSKQTKQKQVFTLD